MACPDTKRLCSHLVISNAVTFADNTLTINIPAGAYMNGEKYCIVVAQNIPDTTTVSAPVVITIGTGATTYALTNCDCSPVLACAINSRTRYSARVRTSTTGGVFQLLGKLPCSRCTNNLPSLPVEEAAGA